LLGPVDSTFLRSLTPAIYLNLASPHYVGEFENAALFLRLGLPSALIRHENGAFRKRSSNWRKGKHCDLAWKENVLKFTGAFGKRRRENRVIYLPEFFLKDR